MTGMRCWSSAGVWRERLASLNCQESFQSMGIPLCRRFFDDILRLLSPRKQKAARTRRSLRQKRRGQFVGAIKIKLQTCTGTWYWEKWQVTRGSSSIFLHCHIFLLVSSPVAHHGSRTLKRQWNEIPRQGETNGSPSLEHHSGKRFALSTPLRD